jgi:hypothetical protein
MANVSAGYNWVSGETVTPAKLNSAAAPTVVLADGEVTDAKLATGIDASKLTTGTLPIDRIADDTVTDAKLSLAANAGEVKKALNADNAPPIYACRAWVNFDGSTVTNVGGEDRCTIVGSGNVTKVVRTGTGAFTIHFTTSMPSTNYAVVGAANAGGGNAVINVSYNTRSAGTINIVTGAGYRAGFTFGVAVSTETSVSIFA